MSIGVVAIGRNEGERLRVCLASALRASSHVVYVDSGSADSSVAMAKQLGASVVELDLSIPFTAARARNAGFEKLVEIAPDVELVQFVDGDCEIVEGWIDRAAIKMRAVETQENIARADQALPHPVLRERAGVRAPVRENDPVNSSDVKNAPHPNPVPEYRERGSNASCPDTTPLTLHKPQAAVMCGRRRERFPDASIYNKLCDIEWNTPIGKTRSCGGDAMIRASAFRAVKGYDESIIAGEEPEMCVRLRAAGWEIWRIDDDMTLHDAAMTKFSQWWKRTLRSGHAYAEGYALHGGAPERHNAKQIRSIWIWGFALPLACAIATAAVAILKPRWCWIPPLALLLYPLLLIKVAMNKRRAGLNLRDAIVYGFFVVLGKFPQAIGAMKFRLSRIRGKRTTLIEYKSTGDKLPQDGGQRVA